MSHNNSTDHLNRPGDSELGIPSIQVTTDASTPRLTTLPSPDVGSPFSDSYPSPGSPPPEPSRSPSEQGLLAPISILRSGRPSLDVPASPTASSWGSDGSTHVPPSPTLSTRSSLVQFANQTSLALRDNHPTERSGYSSLGLLSAHGPGHGHARKSSNASTLDGSTEDTEPDSHSLGMLTPVATPSPTHSQFETASVGGTTVHEHSPSRSHLPDTNAKGEGERHDDADAEAERPVLDLTQDENFDAAPFAFKPVQLASLVDPKNLPALTQMGGTAGLLKGLGTHAKQGLTITPGPPHPSDNGKGKGVDLHGDGRPGTGTPTLGAGLGASQRHDRWVGEVDEEAVPGIVVTGDDGEEEIAKMAPSDVGSDKGPDDAYAATIEDRHRVYGENVLPSRKTKSLLQLMWLALKDKVLVLLSIAAIVSLALGFFQDFGTPRPDDEPPVDWVEGVAIIVAILIVVMVGSLNDWQKERQFQVLNEKKEERGVKVIRGGQEQVIDIRQVVVGDIALVEPGEIIPCDGVFLSGHNVRCDESGATGESDAIRKLSYEECMRAHEKGDAPAHSDCFMVSGSKVLEGYGSYVVIAVGTKSFNGRIMMALRGDTENTPLQLKLNDLAELIAKLGSAAGLILFTALMIRFFVQLGTNSPQRTSNQKGIAFVQILIISVTLIVVAVPEGLPLAVTLALAFATKRMTKEKLLVRVLGSCETMANASVVCTDKTGTLTQNEMTVVAGSLGIHCKFVHHLDENKSRTNAGEEPGVKSSDASRRKHCDDFSIDQTELNDVLSDSLKDLLNASVAINSTAFEDAHPDTGAMMFVGSKTETALLKFAKENGWADYKRTRESADIKQMLPFSSERKAMGVVVRLPSGRFRLYLKGASEILTRLCTQHIVVCKPEDNPKDGRDIETRDIDEHSYDNIQRTIIFYANQTLRTIALCYRDFESWPPKGVQVQLEDEVPYETLAREMTLIGIVGIEDPLRPGVREAVANCQKAGVAVKMCTGDNVLTARSIAMQCGIYTAGGIIMEGPVFRQLSDEDVLEVVPRLQVLARSSPEDKKLLVEKLKELGEIVGVTGDGTNDGPALKTADVGFSMGIAGTEVAKEASDIILMDDNFSSIVKAIMWGRCVNDAVRKFLQFQISTNITAVIITFVSAVASSSEESVLSAVQLLWINIIMDTFAALALATDPASESSLDRKPDKKTSPLFTVDMYKQIFGQSAYQTFITLIFHFLGARILGFHHTDDDKLQDKQDKTVQTLVFNIFVFAQVFNSINSRRLDNKFNIFEGVLRNWYFMSITLIEIGVQILIVFVGGAAFQVTRVGGREWGISLALGFVSIPLGALLRAIPNAPVERFFVKMRLMPQQELLPTSHNVEWNSAIDLIRDNLSTFSHVRGARMRASSYVDRSRKARKQPQQRVAMSSLMTMVPTLVASSIGAGWHPASPHGLSDPAQYDPSKSSAALWDSKIQIHPDTKPDDPAFKKWGHLARTP
ncbi:cation-translocating P-type ATPase [Phanerochaete sordida]|uniref:Calcium-transporting ATPase n=1 Tax=Phanerochaete sordida TaxID=48140 RepID=A0A9P3GF73_9APHY|nr:cation-translocating P-type ATPase [Phanerochaete sordida]